MTTIQQASSVATLIAAATTVLQSDGAKKVYKGLAKAERVSNLGGAITSVSAQTNIISRAFVDESIMNEVVVANLMRRLHEWYAAQIVSALHLSKMIDNGRSVQDVMALVQTGHNKPFNSIAKNILSNIAGQESLNVDRDAMALESLDGYIYGMESTNPLNLGSALKELNDSEAENKNLKNQLKQNKATGETQSVRSVKVGDAQIGPLGELYEVKFSNPNDPSSSITVPIFIQMQPTIIPGDIAPRFVDMNVAPSLWQRWTQMNAGEISFWSDFVKGVDLAKRYKSILKDPQSSAIFGDFLKTVGKKDAYALYDITTKNNSANLSNSVVVFSQDTIARAKADSAVDLHNHHDRERYFRDTYTMIIAIIDPMHQRVTIYFNGIDGEVDIAYSELRGKDNKVDPGDFMAAIQAFSSNSVSRIR